MGKDRLRGLGSSDIAAVVGMNPWKGAFEVYLEKVGLTESPEDNEAMYWGRAMEAPIIKRYEIETGRKVVIHDPESLPLIHPVYPWYMVSPDGLVGFNIVEAKTAGDSQRYRWGEPGTDEIPEEYFCQCQWQLGLTGGDWADVPVLFMGRRREFQIYRVNRDQELIDTLVEKAKDFWENHVIPQVPPPIDGSKGAKEFLKRKYPADTAPMLEPTDESILYLIFRYRNIRDERQTTEKAEAEAMNQLKNIVGDAEGMQGAWGKVFWRKNKDSQFVDWEGAFIKLRNLFLNLHSDGERDIDEITKENTKTKPGARVWKPYFTKEER